MKTADIEYIDEGLFTKFFPNTTPGEAAWREMAKSDGVASFLSLHKKSIISQLRLAGYTVQKASSKILTEKEFQELFA